MKIIFKSLMFCSIFLLLNSISFGGNDFFNVKQQEGNYNTIINTTELATPIFEKVRGYTYYKLGMTVGYSYSLDLLSPKELDKKYTSCKGALGLYIFKDTYHLITILNSLPTDMFMMVAAHEYAHAWERENCPSLKNKFISEGFAEWTAYKVLQLDGAYSYCNNDYATKQILSLNAFEGKSYDYSGGLKFMIDLENKYGIQYVVNYVKTYKE